MCIRDRSLPYSVKPNAFMRPNSLPCNVNNISEYWLYPFFQEILYINPVSYTHLRAHETVLDLVCRLLLEKKKKYKKKNLHINRHHNHKQAHAIYTSFHSTLQSNA